VNKELAAELASMVEEDQRLRQRLMDSVGADRPPPRQVMMEMNRLDVAHTDRLRQIVEAHGWPGRSLVGSKGANDAWLLAQHADKQLDFQRHVLGLLEAAVAAGEANATDLAYLTDRVRMNEGREQVYGTQVTHEPDGVAPWPLEEPDSVDQRRESVGLGPLAEYLSAFGSDQPAPKPHPL
jgi:hypothetical protein